MISTGGAIRKLDFITKPSPGIHYIWTKIPGSRFSWPVKVERTRSQPTASNTPFLVLKA